MKYLVTFPLTRKQIAAWSRAHGGEWMQVGDYLAEVLHESGEDYLLGDFVQSSRVLKELNVKRRYSSH
jgi:hypothetical protein